MHIHVYKNFYKFNNNTDKYGSNNNYLTCTKIYFHYWEDVFVLAEVRAAGQAVQYNKWLVSCAGHLPQVHRIRPTINKGF